MHLINSNFPPCSLLNVLKFLSVVCTPEQVLSQCLCMYPGFFRTNQPWLEAAEAMPAADRSLSLFWAECPQLSLICSPSWSLSGFWFLKILTPTANEKELLSHLVGQTHAGLRCWLSHSLSHLTAAQSAGREDCSTGRLI